jgi:hypothetical protein
MSFCDGLVLACEPYCAASAEVVDERRRCYDVCIDGQSIGKEVDRKRKLT